MEKFPRISINRVSQFPGAIKERPIRVLSGETKITRHPKNRPPRFQTANYPVASFLASYSKRIIEQQIAASFYR